jgi:spermidine synthase
MKTLRRARGVSHDLIVTQEGNTITLWSAAGVRHSVLDLEAPHTPGLEYARNTLLSLAFAPHAKSILLLGLGGGSICHMLFTVRPEARIDAVEIDPAIPKLAEEYFRLGSSRNLEIHIDDAASFLAKAPRKYDIIILDAYVGERLPAQCATREFFGNVREHLDREGVLVINWMSGDRRQFQDVLSLIKAAIGPIWILRGYRSHNSLIFASLRQVTRQALAAEAAQLEFNFPFARSVAKLVRQMQPAAAYSPQKLRRI